MLGFLKTRGMLRQELNVFLWVGMEHLTIVPWWSFKAFLTCFPGELCYVRAAVSALGPGLRDVLRCIWQMRDPSSWPISFGILSRRETRALLECLCVYGAVPKGPGGSVVEECEDPVIPGKMRYNKIDMGFQKLRSALTC